MKTSSKVEIIPHTRLRIWFPHTPAYMQYSISQEFCIWIHITMQIFWLPTTNRDCHIRDYLEDEILLAMNARRHNQSTHHLNSPFLRQEELTPVPTMATPLQLRPKQTNDATMATIAANARRHNQSRSNPLHWMFPPPRTQDVDIVIGR
jgi:hypothetical protein